MHTMVLFRLKCHIHQQYRVYGGDNVMKWKSESELLTVFLSGEIDHCAAERLRERIEALIEKNHSGFR